jgi:NAD(P)-dependent dehydrogenase (short-subunit alcohol dehydrogenase family)
VHDGQVKDGEVQAIGIECDVSSEMAVKKAMAEILEKFGRIDSLVASAGERNGSHTKYY